VYQHHLRHLEARGVREGFPPAASELALRARRARRFGLHVRSEPRVARERVPAAPLRAREATAAGC
jgi:hypothetical protein